MNRQGTEIVLNGCNGCLGNYTEFMVETDD